MISLLIVLGCSASLAACSPKVQVTMPNEPITINMNVKIRHEILVKVDKEIDTLFDENSDLF
ncbi:YnbE family lipoprotein [Marinobacterium sp. CAU 1594]|nr:YnbE family lipoprotein [Marinobacterium arenosum]